MTVYARLWLDSDEPDIRDRMYFELHRSPPAEAKGTRAMQLSVAETSPTIQPMVKQPMDAHTHEAQLVCALREAAAQTRKAEEISALRALATVLENMTRYRLPNRVDTVCEMAAYLAAHHVSRPYRSAFEKASRLLERLRNGGGG